MSVSLEEEASAQEGPSEPAGPHGHEQAVGKAWMRGLGAVAIRRICLHVFGFAAGVVLARVLNPPDFGIFFIANFYVSTLGSLQTTNMAGALIQSREAPTKAEEATLFTLEQALALTAILLVGAAGGIIYGTPWLPQARSAYPYVLALALVWFIRGFEFIPTVHLTRGLQFARISLADAAAQTAFYLCAVGFALAGAGGWSFVAATLIQALLRVVVLSWLSPWRVRLGFSREAVRKYFGTGLSLTGCNLVNMARENLSPSLGALFYGSAGVGLYGWAVNLAGTAKIPAFIFNQIGFSAYSRVQDSPHAIARMLGFTFRVTTVLAGLVLLVLGGFGEHLVQFVYGEKWRPALPVLYVYAAATPLALFINPQMYALFGTGNHRRMLRIELAWLTGTALLGFLLMPRFSYFGLAIAYGAVVLVVAAILFTTAYPEVRRSVLSTTARFLAALGAALVTAWLLRSFISGGFALLGAVLLSAGVYAGIAAALFWRDTRGEVAWFLGRA